MPISEYHRFEPIDYDHHGREAKVLRDQAIADAARHAWKLTQDIWNWLDLSAAGLRIAERPPVTFHKPVFVRKR